MKLKILHLAILMFLALAAWPQGAVAEAPPVTLESSIAAMWQVPDRQIPENLARALGGKPVQVTSHSMVAAINKGIAVLGAGQWAAGSSPEAAYLIPTPLADGSADLQMTQSGAGTIWTLSLQPKQGTCLTPEQVANAVHGRPSVKNLPMGIRSDTYSNGKLASPLLLEVAYTDSTNQTCAIRISLSGRDS